MTKELSRCQKQLLRELGGLYREHCIDGAHCVYRDFGDYDVEICGGRTIRAPFHVFVWQKKPHMKIIQRYLDVPHDYSRVAALLRQIEQQYEEYDERRNLA